MLLQQPVESSGYRKLLVAIPDGNGLEYVLLLSLSEDNYLSGEVCYCELDGEDKAKFVSAVDVTEVTKGMSLPCYDNSERIEDVSNVCIDFINNLSEAKEWKADEVVADDRADIATRMLECRYNG